MNKASETLCWMKEARHKRLHIIYFHLYKISRDANLQNLKVDWCLALGLGMVSDYKWAQVIFGDDATLLQLDVVMVAQICRFTKNHGIFRIKWVHLMVYKFYFNTADKNTLNLKQNNTLKSSSKVSFRHRWPNKIFWTFKEE